MHVVRGPGSGACQSILAIPFKRAVKYLEHNEMQALPQAPDRSTASGRRGPALPLTMQKYNTGARVREIPDLCSCDLQPDRPGQALLRGNGGKRHCCPSLQETAALLRELLGASDVDPEARQPLLRNRSGRPLMRFGVRCILPGQARGYRCGQCAHTGRQARRSPSAAAPFRARNNRHAAASRFLQAGVDLITIGRRLGHARGPTTSIYASVDLESNREAALKAKALFNRTPGPQPGGPRPTPSAGWKAHELSSRPPGNVESLALKVPVIRG